MRVYFGKVYVDGLHKVPKDKPLILAANHQSAFIEPVLLGGIMPFPVHFITRGDIFVKRWMWFFNAVNMVPIFRFHDGFSQMKKNMNSFQHVYNALANGARIIIFCEGQMKWEKKLHSLQLGAARMAVGAHEQNRDLDIYIVPIGINYEDHLTFRRYVRISFGDAIRLTDHTSDLDKSPRPALKSVTEELALKLKPEVIHIATDKHYELGNKLVALHDNTESRRFFPFLASDLNSTEASIHAANQTALLDSDNKFLSDSRQYESSLNDGFIYKDYALYHANEFGILRKIWFFLIVLPVGLIGTALNGLPFYLGTRIAYSQATVPEFIGSLKSHIGFFAYLFYLLVIELILFCYSWQMGLIGLIVFFVTGIFALYFHDRIQYWRAYYAISSYRQDKKQHLLELRNRLLKKLKHASTP